MSRPRNAAQRRLDELSAANDRMSQADKKFFERFPNRRHRVRLAHMAEVEAGAVVNGMNPTQLPSDFKHFVAVKFLSPDCRMRLSFIGLEGSETDVARASFREQDCEAVEYVGAGAYDLLEMPCF